MAAGVGRNHVKSNTVLVELRARYQVPVRWASVMMVNILHPGTSVRLVPGTSIVFQYNSKSKYNSMYLIPTAVIWNRKAGASVSYTHLTLPTILLV